jgi:hypothetical protein
MNEILDKPVVPSRALTNLEDQISADYFFFNSTGKFPHKYLVQGYGAASDMIDYEKKKLPRCTFAYLYTNVLFWSNACTVGTTLPD